MFSFMKHKHDKDKKDKDEKKKEKKDKKEKEKKEKHREPVTADELKRLEEIKKGVFRRFSDRDKHKKAGVKAQDGEEVKRDTSDSSISSGSSRPSPIREEPPTDKKLVLTKPHAAPTQPEEGKKAPPTVMPKPRGILKGAGDGNHEVDGGLDDTLILQQNTKLNEEMSGVLPAKGVKPKVAPRQKNRRKESTDSDGRAQEILEEPVEPEKTFNAELALPTIVPPKPPRVRELVINRQPAGGFGFTLRKGVVMEKGSGDAPDSKQFVIFAEPGSGPRTSQTGLIPGDRLVEVNGVNVETLSREDIVELIKQSGETVTLKVQPIPELVELSVRPGSENGLLDVQDSVVKGGTLQRSGSLRYKKGARSETEVQSEKSWMESERVWLVHKGGFASACMLKVDGMSPLPEGRVRIKLDQGGDILEVDEEDIEKANPPQFDRSEDLVSLRHLNESSSLHTLRQRYGGNLTHTYAGPSMIVINPMHSLSVYSEKVIQMFKGCKQEDMPPHIYATAQIAYRNLLNSRRDQSIVFLGRSGSGKTTCSRHVLHYLTLANGSVNNILTVDKLNAITTLLEAFGNSRTILNTTASRFAQLTTLDFDYSGQIASASLQVLMFEKTRVVRRPEGEPTFHVFYQMLAGVDSLLRNELQLNVLNEPNLFMTPLQRAEDRQKASQAWAKIHNATEVVGINEDEFKALCFVLAAIYHLGVAAAVKGSNNKPQFSRPAAAQKAATLLGTTVEELSRQIFTAGSSTLTRSTSMRTGSPADKHGGGEGHASAMDALEGFVIGLYSDIFNAIVSLINRSLSSTIRASASVTVVDTPGFQNPATCGRQSGASFEDLCHNYCQEKLQLLFHDLTFTLQQDQYSQENVDCDFEFVTTSPAALISLIDKPSQQALTYEAKWNSKRKPSVSDKSDKVRQSNPDLQEAEKKGLLWILDEEAIFPGASEDSFMDRFFTHHGEKKVRRDSLLRKASSLGNTFILNHFQGTNPVQYNASGWLKVCRENPVAKVATQVLQDSKKSNINQLFNSVKAPVAGMVSGSIVGMEGSSTLKRVGSMRRTFMSGTAGLKKRSMCLQVKFQVDSIIEMLRKTKCHFVHCILPQHNAGLCELKTQTTPEHKPGAGDEGLMNVILVRAQLRGNEILDAIRIYRQGFPDHMGLSEFRQRFQGLVAPASRPSKDMEEKQAAAQIMENLDIDKLNYRIGLSRVFFRAGALNQLEAARDEKITGTVIAFQAYCRGYLGRKKLGNLRVKHLAVTCIQKNVRKFMIIRDWPWWRLYTKVKPLLNVHRTEEELREKEVEIEQLRVRLEKLEKERNEYKLQCEKLENRLSEVSADLAEENNASSHATELLENESADRMRLEKELKDLQSKHTVLKRHTEKLEMEVMQVKLWQAQAAEELEEEDDPAVDSVYKDRYQKILRELQFTKKRLQHQHEEEMEHEQTAKKQLEKRLHDALEEVEEHKRQLGAAKKKAQRLASEKQDSKLHLEEQMTRNNDLERKQRRFDAELLKAQEEAREERHQREKLQRERDENVAEKYAFEQEMQRTKMDMEIHREKAERLDKEMMDLTFTTGTTDNTELVSLKRSKHELESKIQEQEEELDDQAGQIQQLEQTKLRLEMSLEKLRQQHLKELEEKEEEMEEMRFATQKKLKQMESQMEEEYDEKRSLVQEKRELERQITELGAQSPKRDREGEKRLRRDLRKTKALLRDAETMLQKQKSAEGTKGTIRQLRNQLDDAEFASAAAIKAKKTMELEIQDLQQQLDDIFRSKSEADNKCMALLREKSDIQSQLEENEEDLADIMKKYKAVVSQQSVDQIKVTDQLRNIEELTTERDALKHEVHELRSKVQVFEESSVDKNSVSRLENKIRELETKFELEQTTRHRLEVQIGRIKDHSDKVNEEKENMVLSKQQADEVVKRAQRELRDLREEFSDVQKREMEMSHKSKELETRISEMEVDHEQSQSDLKLAFKRISDLHAALQEDLDSDIDLTDSEDDLDDDSDVDNVLVNHRHSGAAVRRQHSLGSSTGSNPRSRMQSNASSTYEAAPSSPR